MRRISTYRGDPMREVRLNRSEPATADAVGRLRHAVVDFAESVGASDATSDAVRLAVSEALTNVVVHAYVGREPGPMIVQACLNGKGALSVFVCDEGPGPMPHLHGPGLGLGLGLMAQLADAFGIENRQPRGTILSLRFSLAGPGS
jgi:serine/threonine-protein kinase RsbW/stage II sporulation protein AB (anti-sigma F factor)